MPFRDKHTITIVVEVDCIAAERQENSRLILWLVDGTLDPDKSFEEYRSRALEVTAGYDQQRVMETKSIVAKILRWLGYSVECDSTCND